MARRLVADPEPVGDSAWVMRSSLPRLGTNVFAIRTGRGVTLVDSGSRESAAELRRVCGRLGGLEKVVLTHAHPDHRGGARLLGAPVLCHRDEAGDVEGDAGRGYMTRAGRAGWRVTARWTIVWAIRDGGATKVDQTVAEGDAIGDYRVVELPGHSPGHIGLFSEREQILLAGDAFYATREGGAQLPRAAFDLDHAQALRSVQRAAMLRPRVAWPAHGPALEGDVCAKLEAALAVA
jgi:glyoxylase-like metal-dependent hydrolase (beta-lactamase superfamily II)